MLPLAQAALFSHPQQSTPTELPPRHSAPFIRVSKRKRQCDVSQDEDPHPPTASQLRADLNPSSSTTTSTTTTSLSSPVTSRVIRDPPRGRGGRLSHVPAPSVQYGRHEKTPPTPLAPDGYSAGHIVSPQQQSLVGSMDEPYAKRRRVDNGQSQTGHRVKETNASMSQLPQPIYGHSPTDAPSHTPHIYAHTHPSTHPPTQSSSTYAGPIHTAPPQWTRGGNVQGQEHYYHNSGPTACVQPAQMRADHQSLHDSTTGTTRTHNFHIPVGPPCSRPGLNLQSTPSMSPGHVPLRNFPPTATEPLHTGSVSSPDGPRSISSGYAPLSSVFPLVLSESAILFPRDDTIGWSPGPSTTDDVLNVTPLSGSVAWGGVICPAQSQPEGPQDALCSSYHFENPISTPQYNQSLSSILIPKNPPLPSPLWPTQVAFSPVEGPSSYLPRPPLQANLTTSGQTPHAGGGRTGSDLNINVDIAGSNGKPVSLKFNHEIGPDRSGRTHTTRESKPYQRPIPAVTRKTRPVKYEDNLERLQQRCREQGADGDAIGLLGKVFANEVSQAALTRSLTDVEVETRELGIVTGKVYSAFLEPTDEGEGAAPRYVCRLCHSDQTWKHTKDTVRHLKRDHFGLSDACETWYVFHHLLTLASIDSCASRVCSGKRSYTKGERTRHHCK